MSQWVSFTLLPAAEFAKRQADPNATSSEGGERFALDPLWYNFHELFRDEPGVLRYVIQGDVAERPIELCLGLVGGREDEGDGTYFAYVSPEVVKAIDVALKGFPLWKVIDRIRKKRPEWVRHKPGRDSFSAAFEQLVRVYAVAAKRGDALVMLVC